MGKNLRVNMTPERQAEVFSYFENGFAFSLDLAEETQMQGLMEQYLFYDTAFSERNIRVCHCTSCGGHTQFRADSPWERFWQSHHNDEIDCPNCNNAVTMKALGRMYNFSSINDTDERRFSIFRVAPDGGLMVISGWGRRKFSHNELSPDIDFREKERAYFGPGERMRWRRTWDYAGLNRTGYAWPAGWEACEWMGEPFNPSLHTRDGSYYPICAERIGDTKLRYCQVEDWYFDRCKVILTEPTERVRFVLKFLALYTEYPNIEMACRLGFYDSVDQLVDHGRMNHKILDWGAKTSWGFLRLSKADGKAFLKADCDLGDLELLAAARKWDKGLTLAKFWELLDRCRNDSRTVELLLKASKLSRLSPQKILHYLEMPGTTVRVRAQLLTDYLEFAKILKYDLKRQDVALPKDLADRHDAAASTVAIIQAKERKAEADRKYSTRISAVAKMYEFSLGGLSIVAPVSPEDIVEEGKKQGHCVGGYAARHFSGILEILFLRRTVTPGKPWITLEVAHRKQPTSRVVIKQMYDAGNRHGLLHWKKEVGWFIDAWTAWLEAGSPRDRNGLPIIEEYKEVSA